jgi:hypothetical protein
MMVEWCKGTLSYVLTVREPVFARPTPSLIVSFEEPSRPACLLALGDMFSFLFHRNTNLYAMFAFPLGRI